MKKLKDRWFTTDGKRVYDKLTECFLRNIDLADVNGLSSFEGRYDLRGITFPASFSVNSYKLQDVDLSYSTLYDSIWKDCQFINVIFRSAKADYCRFWACEFDQVVFEKTYLNDASMNGAREGDSGYFKRTQFIECNLKGSSYYNALFQGCKFRDCNLHLVDFNGSRFENCKFTGKLVEVFFRGWPLVNRELYPHVHPLPNKMLNVDFRDAILKSVMFLDSIDLSHCLFPVSDDYVIIRGNRNKVFEYARKEIESDWQGVERKIGLALIDQSYLDKRKIGNQMELVDRNYLLETNREFGVKFFELVKRLNDQLNIEV